MSHFREDPALCAPIPDHYHHQVVPIRQNEIDVLLEDGTSIKPVAVKLGSTINEDYFESSSLYTIPYTIPIRYGRLVSC